MKKVTYFDVEWANNKNKSICQMGIMCENFEDGEPIYPEKNVYVNPEDRFEDGCVRVHHITAEKVAHEPTFPEVWREVEPCFTNSIIIGHNVAGADLDALTKNLQRYNIDIPTLYYVDTLRIAREFVPSFAIQNYEMSTLCKLFGVEIDNEHDAFDDACACKDLFLALHKAYHFSLDQYVHRYDASENFRFVEYVSNPQLRKSIGEFYGTIQGIGMDCEVSSKELEYIKNWEAEHKQFAEHDDVAEIFALIKRITRDSIITPDELQNLHGAMTKYYQNISSSEVTISTQILSGILKGIRSDGVITLQECNALSKWLYEHDYLRGHYPFDKIMELLDDILEDNHVTDEESQYLLSEIDKILNPVASLKTQICSVKGMTICLSGTFSHGSKSKVEEYIKERGGIIVGSVSKKLNILIVGDMGCDAYAHDNYGTKFRRAKELIEQGCSILIIKEEDFYTQIK